MFSALNVGKVQHRRHVPKRHWFEYPVFMVYLDLSELDTVFKSRFFWSLERANLASFYRSDFFGNPSEPLDDAIRDEVKKHTGYRPKGPIRMLTHLRYLGYSFNPVTLYYCFDSSGMKVETILAEITNTPWKERFSYILSSKKHNTDKESFTFDKAFHVSPFMPMDLRYDWRFTTPRDTLNVHMRLEREEVHLFDASLILDRRPLTGRSMAWVLIRFPLMTLQVITGIYWQAFLLKLKNIPFYDHPEHKS